MGLIDKFKNLFTEEVEVEEKESKKDTIQKEVIQVEIPSPKKSRSEFYSDEASFNNDAGVQIENETPMPTKSEYKFPFFDDNDFDSIDVKPESKEEKKQSHNRKEVYKPAKEEKKIFRPSPIISPVYGILDKGYQREEFKSKTDGRSSYYSSKEANVDAIRNKAYGGLEADIETTLFGGNRVLFNEKEEEPQKDVIQKVLEDEKLDDTPEANYTFDSSTLDEKPRHGAPKEDDLTDLLEEEMDKSAEEEKHKKEPRKISDQELFSLIDSMYEKGNK